jgi:hypothetical protein
MTALFQSWGLTHEWAWGLATLAGILAIALPLLVAVAMSIYFDRKIWAAMALRRGPNVVGPWGLLQSFADGLKVFLQETIIPSAANKGLFLIAPIITFAVALMSWAVVPFNSGAVLADINVGLLYILAISSLGVYGVVMAGWSSNSKYPFFSAMRAAAQMISYEVSIGFILICVEKSRLDHQWLRRQSAAVPDVGDVSDLKPGRNRPRPVRFDRGGKRTCGRLPDRILLNELCRLLAGRICQCAADVRAQCNAVLRRMAAAAGLGAALSDPRLDLAVHQDRGLLLHFQLGQGDRASLSL